MASRTALILLGIFLPLYLLISGVLPSMAAPVQNESHTNVSAKPFGRTQAGEEISQFILTNKNGLTAKVITYGATLTELMVPDKNGKLDNIVLGFDAVAPYETVSPYFGATVGRCANRIAGATFDLNGQEYRLSANDGKNTLHGGKVGFSKKVWHAHVIPSPSEPSVEFSLESPDGDEGFPGNIQVTVRYTLTEDNKLDLKYTAQVDKPCPTNLTNHAYFNLSGAGNPSILEHLLTLKSSLYTPVNSQLIPTGELLKVTGTPMDFTQAKPIGKDLEKVVGGYDHNFVIDESALRPDKTREAARLFDPSSGRVVVMYTTEPGVQFYSGNFLDGTIHGIGGVYPKHSALCLEAQHFPDAPHQKNFPSVILKPGETYSQHTIYAFSTEGK